MKKQTLKSILIISLLFLVTACSTYTYKDMNIDENLWLFANDILANPAKLSNIKEYYPELVNDTLLEKGMKDSIEIENLINKIIYFDNLWRRSILFYDVLYDANIKHYRKLEQYKSLKVQDLLGFGFQKGDNFIVFEFIKRYDKYFLFYIAYIKETQM